jgi:mRNA degradation ribonuclease J1/J2
VLRARRRLAYDGVAFVADVNGRLRVSTMGVAAEAGLAAMIAGAEAAAEEARRQAAGGDVAGAVRRAVARAFFAARGKKPRVIALV